jgi:hypothetical protein
MYLWKMNGDEWEMIDEFIRIIVWYCKMNVMDECKMNGKWMKVK